MWRAEEGRGEGGRREGRGGSGREEGNIQDSFVTVKAI